MKKMTALGLLLLSAVMAHAQMRLPQCQANAVCPTFAAPNFEILPGGVLIWPDGSTSNSAGQAGTVPAGSVTAGTFGLGVLLPAAQVVAGSLGANVIASSIAANGVTPATYGSATQSAQVAVGADGRVTSASNVTITGVPAASVPATGVQAGSLATGVKLSTANVSPAFNGANELVQFNGSGAYPAADASLLTYSGAGAGAIPFFTTAGSTLSNNANFLSWDNVNHRLGIRTANPIHGIDCSSCTLYIDGNASNPIQVGNSGSLLNLSSAGNLTIPGIFTASSSSQNYAAFVSQPSDIAPPPAGVVQIYATATNGFTRLLQDNEAPTDLVLGRDNVYIAQNVGGATMFPGQVVFATGNNGNVPTVLLAKADVSTSAAATGIVVDTITNNSFGQIMFAGIVNGVNTSGFSAGDALYVSPTSSGSLTNVRPMWPNLVSRIGTVVNSAASGSILVEISSLLGTRDSGTIQAKYTVGAPTSGSSIILDSVNNSTFTNGVVASSFAGSGYNLTGITVSSCTNTPNSTFTNTTFGVALATVTITTRGFPVFFNAVQTIRGSGTTDVVSCGVLVDGGFSTNIGSAALVSQRTNVAAADFGGGIQKTEVMQASGVALAAGSHTFALVCATTAGTGTVLHDATHFSQMCVTEAP